MAIKLETGSAIRNPASPGFFPASQEENEINNAEMKTLNTKLIGLSLK